MMVRIYHYNDLKGFDTKWHNVKSNLCTWYYRDKNKFCGNYCSRKKEKFNRRCWRHTRHGSYSKTMPPLILLMISASERTYNRYMWIEFLIRCEERRVPIELVIYHEDMLNCTVREPHNLLSRFRPFPDIFGKVLPLKDRHGSVHFTQVYLKLLEYACKIPYAARCIVLTERTIPIRSPLSIYKISLDSKCHIDISYNVKFGPEPAGIPVGWGAVNNLCQGLFTTEFLEVALPTVPLHCGKFGISLQNGIYSITDPILFRQWQTFTGSNPSEFLLLNSYLLDNHNIKEITQYMEITKESDKYTVAEIPEWRGGWKRTFVFRDWKKRVPIPVPDLVDKRRVFSYYRGLDLTGSVSLREIIKYLRRQKRRALFFRQVELA